MFENGYNTIFAGDMPWDGRDDVVEFAACGRARWKVENETFNTLKTKGYNLEALAKPREMRGFLAVFGVNAGAGGYTRGPDVVC